MATIEIYQDEYDKLTPADLADLERILPGVYFDISKRPDPNKKRIGTIEFGPLKTDLTNAKITVNGGGNGF